MKRHESKDLNLAMVNPLQVLDMCGGVYICPRDANGNPTGYLVGYAGKYGEQQLQYVGFEYYNFAKAEQYPEIRTSWARNLEQSLEQRHGRVDVFLGAPMGGILFADSLAEAIGARVIFAEKIEGEPTTKGRGESKLVLDRHDLEPGNRVVLVEDVCNNFSTTEKLVALVESLEAVVVGITCILNRSGKAFYRNEDHDLEVSALVTRQFPQYRQDDPVVLAKVARGEVCWKPKKRDQWEFLRKMHQGI